MPSFFPVPPFPYPPSDLVPVGDTPAWPHPHPSWFTLDNAAPAFSQPAHTLSFTLAAALQPPAHYFPESSQRTHLPPPSHPYQLPAPPAPYAPPPDCVPEHPGIQHYAFRADWPPAHAHNQMDVLPADPFAAVGPAAEPQLDPQSPPRPGPGPRPAFAPTPAPAARALTLTMRLVHGALQPVAPDDADARSASSLSPSSASSSSGDDGEHNGLYESDGACIGPAARPGLQRARSGFSTATATTSASAGTSLSHSPAWSFRDSDTESEPSSASASGPFANVAPNTYPALDETPPFPTAARQKKPRNAGSGAPPKKVKMHECRICHKLFPRPSGLATHMNSHSGARPYKCPLASCAKSFAVRSNARRHMRTHGLALPTAHPAAAAAQGAPRFEVGFDPPLVLAPSAGAARRAHARLRWVPPSLAGARNARRLRSLSPGSDMADLDGIAAAPPVPAPLPPAVPSGARAAADPDARFEERDSRGEAGTHPYHPTQWRRLPGPALVVPLKA